MNRLQHVYNLYDIYGTYYLHRYIEKSLVRLVNVVTKLKSENSNIIVQGELKEISANCRKIESRKISTNWFIST